MDCSDAELSILLTDNQEISELNKTYRGVDEPTDVLSFPMDDDHPRPKGRPRMLGDVVISIEMAREMSARYNAPFQTVLDVLLLHGILHLVGYDHERPEKAREMDAKTLDVLGLIGSLPENFDWYLTESWYEKDREGQDDEAGGER